MLTRWADGDRGAGDELIDRHFQSLYRFFVNKVRDSADDLVQQTLVACVEGRRRFRGDSSFRTYLMATARHCLWQHLRKQRRDGVVDLTVDSMADMGTSPTGALARRDRQRGLTAALNRLPVDLQIALELRYWESMTGPEIAQVLGVPLDTAYSRLRRAHGLLRESMQQVPGRGDGDAPSLESWVRGLNQVFETAGDTPSR